MGFLRKLLFLIVVVVVVVVGGAVFYIDRIAATAVERGSTYALGVDTSVDGVSVGLLTGQFGVDGLHVANPSGFETDYFLHVGTTQVALPLTRLREPTITVDVITIDGIDLNLERRGRTSNYDAILQNLARFESSEQKEPPAEGEGPKLVIQELRITDVGAHASLSGLTGKPLAVDVHVPEIRVTEVGSKSGGVTVAELSAIVMKAVLEAISKSGAIPADILRDLRGGLANLVDVNIALPQGVQETVGKALQGDLGETGKGLQEKAEEGVGEVLDGGKEAGKRVLDGLGGLLGGKRKGNGDGE